MAIDAFLYLTKYAESGDGEQIAGECTDKFFPGYIEVEDFDFDAIKDLSEEERELEANREPDTDNGMAYMWETGLARQRENDMNELQDMITEEVVETDSAFRCSFKKDIDKSSTALFKNYCESYVSRGKAPLGKAIFYLRKAGPWVNQQGITKEQMSFLIITIDKPYVVNYELKADEDSHSIPEEEVKFHCSKYSIKYRPQETSGLLKSTDPSPIGYAIGEGEDGGQEWDGAS